jgi:polyhydroxyalkanoate synthesis repressor PhaR
MSNSRIIKKYPNRRLYDTEISRYITLANVRDLVKQGTEFTVIDANSQEDITRSILLQVIVDQESDSNPLFTAEILSKMIRFYGDSAQNIFSNYLENILGLFVEHQSRLQHQFQDLMTTNPLDTMSDLTKRNLEIWQEMQKKFLESSGIKPKRPGSEKATKDISNNG